jgi:hypothetical protein
VVTCGFPVPSQTRRFSGERLLRKSVKKSTTGSPAENAPGAVRGEGLRLRVPRGARARVARVALPFGSVNAVLGRLRDAVIYSLFKLGFLGAGRYSPRPPVVSERGEVVRALGHAFGMSPRQVVRIVKAEGRPSSSR